MLFYKEVCGKKELRYEAKMIYVLYEANTFELVSVLHKTTYSHINRRDIFALVVVIKVLLQQLEFFPTTSFLKKICFWFCEMRNQIQRVIHQLKKPNSKCTEGCILW